MSVIVDFHTHVLSSHFLNFLIEKSKDLDAVTSSLERIQQFRKQARIMAKPIVGSVHHLQTLIRFLPGPIRDRLDELMGILPWPGLLFESSASDLVEAMDQNQIKHALVVADPLYMTNEEVLELAEKNPRFIPVVSLGEGCDAPASVLKKAVQKGAKVLKIAPALDPAVTKSKKYHSLLNTASDLGLPVMLHTGCFRNHSRKAHQGCGQPDFFKPWFTKYSQVKFILVHLNFSEPDAALDLCDEFPNILVETSWQPAEVIGDAARRIGAERVLFGSDWPWIGDNLAVGKNRIEECESMGLLNQDQIQLILGGNAVKLLGLKPNATSV